MIKDRLNRYGSIKRMFIVMTAFSVLVLLGAFLYYEDLKNNEDPRILPAKKLLAEYDSAVKAQDYPNALIILERIEDIYGKYTGYKDSFEPGIVFNNRGSVYLMMYLYKQGMNQNEKNHALEKAKEYIQKSIKTYEQWQKNYQEMNEQQIYEQVKQEFLKDNAIANNSNAQRIIQSRADELLLCKKEINRRLSVSYTNLGTIQRHEQSAEAAETFVHAIKLWPDNYTAKNNLDMLLGRTPPKRSVIDRLFPPDKD